MLDRKLTVKEVCSAAKSEGLRYIEWGVKPVMIDTFTAKMRKKNPDFYYGTGYCSDNRYDLIEFNGYHLIVCDTDLPVVAVVGADRSEIERAKGAAAVYDAKDYYRELFVTALNKVGRNNIVSAKICVSAVLDSVHDEFEREFNTTADRSDVAFILGDLDVTALLETEEETEEETEVIPVDVYNGKIWGETVSGYGLNGGYLDYHALGKMLGCILNNTIWGAVDDWEEYTDFYSEDENGDIEYPDILQWYIIREDGAEFLREHNSKQVVYYSDTLDIYLWGVTHFGTAWTYVLSDIPLRIEQ